MTFLDVSGPEFLAVYLFFLVAAIALEYGLRRRAVRDTVEGGADEIELDPYQIAYLRGGRALATAAAVCRMVRADRLTHVSDDGTFMTREGDKPEYRLERGVLDACRASGGLSFGKIVEAVKADVEPLESSLSDAGLLVPGEVWSQHRRHAAVIFITLLVVGLSKLCVGVAREKPVFLLAMMIGGVCLLLVHHCRREHHEPTPRGRRALDCLESQHETLRLAAGSGNPNAISGADLALAVGIYGVGILATSPMHDLTRSLRSPYFQEGSGASCGASCGSSSCGGGGCGGGGCGGCGGG